jgi:hypothetical protein
MRYVNIDIIECQEKKYRLNVNERKNRDSFKVEGKSMEEAIGKIINIHQLDMDLIRRELEPGPNSVVRQVLYPKKKQR